MTVADHRRPIVHIALPEKFIGPFIGLVTEHFPADRHHFIIRGDHGRYRIPELPNVETITTGTWHPRTLMTLFRAMSEAERIILHGLFCRATLAVLLCCKAFRRKGFWFSWGGDIRDNAMSGHGSLRRRIRYRMRRGVVPDLAAIVCYIPGDADACRRWYQARGAFIRCSKYTSNVVQPSTRSVRAPDAPITIQIGKSASPTSRHGLAFSMVRRLRLANVRVFCPLAYGNAAYAKQVIEWGHRLFGDNFLGQTDFIPREEYDRRLQSVDIVIMAGSRQKGMGNLLTLLAMGVKVHLDPLATSFGYFREKGIRVFSLEEFDGTADFPEREANMRLVADLHSKERLVAGLADVFTHPLRLSRKARK